MERFQVKINYSLHEYWYIGTLKRLRIKNLLHSRWRFCLHIRLYMEGCVWFEKFGFEIWMLKNLDLRHIGQLNSFNHIWHDLQSPPVNSGHTRLEVPGELLIYTNFIRVLDPGTTTQFLMKNIAYMRFHINWLHSTFLRFGIYKSGVREHSLSMGGGTGGSRIPYNSRQSQYLR